jgi:hypothetical protein
MKKNIETLLTALLVIAVIYLSYNYLNRSMGPEKEPDGNYTIDVSDTMEHPPAKAAKETPTYSDETITKLVDAYQEGYREGCRENAGKPRSTQREKKVFERAYTLGFDKGKTFCTAKRKREKELLHRGAEEGCQSALGKYMRDETLYTQNKTYKKSWDKGYKKCKPTKTSPKSETVPQQKKKQERTNQAAIDTRSEAYRLGYRQGCDRSRGGYQKRDERRYFESKEYRAGWTKGREECKSEPGTKRQATTPRTRPTQRYNEPYYFDLGYDDGCDSARGFFRRDREHYVRHESYREGWQRGKFECSRRPPPVVPPPPVPFNPFGF